MNKVNNDASRQTTDILINFDNFKYFTTEQYEVRGVRTDLVHSKIRLIRYSLYNLLSD